ncbi:MAG TPA: glycerol-3-phosphate 1-O-acyltransferase PlsY [Candidatus Scatomorpha pullicola]|nr:glycerol-3-phosphate 1-O-acyltransferase PlsY [Candidatus Scatomorpha pullicola]
MLITLMLALTAIIGYIMGSVNGSIIVSRFLFGSDVRRQGSGNAGLTNFYRTYGITGIVGVIAIDVLKGVLGTLIGGLLLNLAAPAGFEAEFTDVGRLVATFCVILGHVFPIFYGFKGGKGILTGVSCVFVVDYRAALIALVIFAIIVVATHYVSLGSVLSTLSVPVTLLANGFSGICMILTIVSVALIVIKHAENISRLIHHKEPKISFKKDLSHKLDNDGF